MWAEDIIKSLIFDERKYTCCINKIENGVIYFSNGETKTLKEGVREYDSEINISEDDFE